MKLGTTGCVAFGIVATAFLASCWNGDDGAGDHRNESSQKLSVSGPNPCQALNPIYLAGPRRTVQGAPNETVDFDLPISANLCVYGTARGAIQNGDALTLRVDGADLASTASCTDKNQCESLETSLTLAIPFRLSAGHHTLVFTGTVGSDATSTLYLFAQGPAITSFTPATAAPGDRVTIRGEGLGSARVTVAGETYVVHSVAAGADSAVVTVPAQPAAGTFNVRNALGVGSGTGVFVPFNRLCAPAFTIPQYTPPPDDSAAFEALAEASGYAFSGNSDWVDASAGDLCGGPEKELLLLKNRHSYFSVMRSPDPHVFKTGDVGSTGDLDSSDANPWRAVAVGNLDRPSPKPEPGEFDPTYAEIVAVRKLTETDVPDVVVARASPSSCEVSTIIATAAVGGVASSDWVGVAIGDFDKQRDIALGTNDIVLLRNGQQPNFVFMKFEPGTFPETGSLRVFYQHQLDNSPALPWKAVAAGDIDGDGIDEVIAARNVSDGHSATVLVYKWNGTEFQLFATSTVGNHGDSDWASAAVGDFNADGRAAIVLAKNTAPNFTLLAYPPGSTGLLSQITNNDLDSVAGQEWRAVVATDWLSGFDQGAAELIAVRAAHTDTTQNPPAQYRTDLYVYGDDFHRVPRDTALAGVKAQAYYLTTRNPETEFSTFKLPWTPELLDELISTLRQTHTNTYHWLLQDRSDYEWLVKFLQRTKQVRDSCIDGRQLRVRVTLITESADKDANGIPLNCSWPDNLIETSWKESDFFPTTFGTPDVCRDLVGWGKALGRLAQEYPQLVAVGYDDFSYRIDPLDGSAGIYFADEQVAEFQSNLREQARWVSFVPTVYYDWAGRGAAGGRFIGQDLPDIGRMYDSMLFYFRNEKVGSCTLQPPACDFGAPVRPGCDANGRAYDENSPAPPEGGLPCPNTGCLAGTCAESSISDAPSELCDMKTLLPAGRKLELGIYFLAHSRLGEPSARYDYDLARLVMTRDWMHVNGVTVYTTPAKDPAHPCGPETHLDDGNRFCTVQRLFVGGDTTTVSHIDLTQASCASARAASGDPFGYAFDAAGVQTVVYRGGNHIFELSRTTADSTYRNLSSDAHPTPDATTDPTAYVVGPSLAHHVLYRGSDEHVHTLQWPNGFPPYDLDLTASANAPGAASGSRPFGFAVDSLGLRLQNVLYRATDGNLHRLWSSSSSFTDDNLSGRARTSSPAGDPFGYVFGGTQFGVYRTTDRRLFELSWIGTGGTVLARDLTSTPGATEPGGDPMAYVAPAFNTQNVVYRGITGDVMLLSSASRLSAVSVVNLSAAAGAPAAASDPTAYFVDALRTHHVVYNAVDGHLYELRWTVTTYPGAVTARDLAPTRQAPPAVGSPSAYYFGTDETQHVIYRDENGHLHELQWGGKPASPGRPSIKPSAQ